MSRSKIRRRWLLGAIAAAFVMTFAASFDVMAADGKAASGNAKGAPAAKAGNGSGRSQPATQKAAPTSRPSAAKSSPNASKPSSSTKASGNRGTAPARPKPAPSSGNAKQSTAAPPQKPAASPPRSNAADNKKPAATQPRANAPKPATSSSRSNAPQPAASSQPRANRPKPAPSASSSSSNRPRASAPQPSGPKAGAPSTGRTPNSSSGAKQSPAAKPQPSRPAARDNTARGNDRPVTRPQTQATPRPSQPTVRPAPRSGDQQITDRDRSTRSTSPSMRPSQNDRPSRLRSPQSSSSTDLRSPRLRDRDSGDPAQLRPGANAPGTRPRDAADRIRQRPSSVLITPSNRPRGNSPDAKQSTPLHDSRPGLSNRQPHTHISPHTPRAERQDRAPRTRPLHGASSNRTTRHHHTSHAAPCGHTACHGHGRCVYVTTHHHHWTSSRHHHHHFHTHRPWLWSSYWYDFHRSRFYYGRTGFSFHITFTNYQPYVYHDCYYPGWRWYSRYTPFYWRYFWTPCPDIYVVKYYRPVYGYYQPVYVTNYYSAAYTTTSQPFSSFDSVPAYTPSVLGSDDVIDYPVGDDPSLTGGWLLLATGQAREARRAFYRETQIRPADGLPLIGYAISAGLLDRYAEAVAVMRDAMGIDPEALSEVPQHDDVFYMVEELLAYYEQQTRLTPGDPNAWYMTAALRYVIGEYTPAYFAIDRAIELGDSDQSALNLKGQIRSMIEWNEQQSFIHPSEARTADPVL